MTNFRIWCPTVIIAVASLSRGAEALAVSRREAISISIAAATSSVVTADKANAAAEEPAKPSKWVRYPQIRFIAALGDPSASQGSSGSDTWGLWRDDPGPRGVFLQNYQTQLVDRGGVAPAGWTFDDNDWWLEEHGLIMSKPDPLPRKKVDKDTKEVLPYKRYVVTGDREVTTILKVFEDGRWELAKGTLYDVTHLPCRSAKYTTQGGSSCSPTSAERQQFPVKPGAEMPGVAGCSKQDYAVLFVLGEEA
jgi:hypothetical protein